MGFRTKEEDVWTRTEDLRGGRAVGTLGLQPELKRVQEVSVELHDVMRDNKR